MGDRVERVCIMYGQWAVLDARGRGRGRGREGRDGPLTACVSHVRVRVTAKYGIAFTFTISFALVVC